MTIATAAAAAEGVYAEYALTTWISAERARTIHKISQYRFLRAALATGLRTQVTPAGAIRFNLADVLRLEF